MVIPGTWQKHTNPFIRCKFRPQRNAVSKNQGLWSHKVIKKGMSHMKEKSAETTELDPKTLQNRIIIKV